VGGIPWQRVQVTAVPLVQAGVAVAFPVTLPKVKLPWQ
jgi:hypothetical protein